jgi:hypothetical protein
MPFPKCPRFFERTFKTVTVFIDIAEQFLSFVYEYAPISAIVFLECGSDEGTSPTVKSLFTCDYAIRSVLVSSEKFDFGLAFRPSFAKL